MKNFSTWILVMFMIMFWVFRVIVALMYQLHLDFGGIVPLNETIEVILAFVVLVCIILVRRFIISFSIWNVFWNGYSKQCTKYF